jgi:hypothetical protein
MHTTDSFRIKDAQTDGWGSRWRLGDFNIHVPTLTITTSILRNSNGLGQYFSSRKRSENCMRETEGSMQRGRITLRARSCAGTVPGFNVTYLPRPCCQLRTVATQR